MPTRQQLAPGAAGPSPTVVAGLVIVLSAALLFVGLRRPDAPEAFVAPVLQPALPPTSQVIEPRVRDAVGESGRDPRHLALDAERNPEAALALARVTSGMRVLEWAGGSGYFTELLARAVGPDGRVFVTGLNDRALVKRLGNVVPVSNGIQEIPDEGIDLVFTHAHYHQLVAQRVDRQAWLRAAHRVLQLGGSLVVIDHAAIEGSGGRDAARLQRVDEQLVRREALRSGFLFEEASDAFRRPMDDPRRAVRDTAPHGGPGLFALRFVRVGALEAEATSATGHAITGS